MPVFSFTALQRRIACVAQHPAQRNILYTYTQQHGQTYIYLARGRIAVTAASVELIGVE